MINHEVTTVQDQSGGYYKDINSEEVTPIIGSVRR